MQKYFQELEDKVKVCYSIAEEARARGFDPLDKVEIPLARTLAEKVVGLISVVYPQINDEKIIQRILELEKEYGPLDYGVAFKIAEEIAKEKFCKFENLLQAIEAGIRLGFAYFTLGVVSSPIEGFTELKIGKTKDGKEYFVPYFSGPIRSAGTTASCMALILIDYLRELFGYAKYDPDEKEVKRTAVEIVDYHERINNLQYLPTEEEALFLSKNLPIQISGEASEDREVSTLKDLPRVNTNFIRGGMCLIFAEGLAQKAQKAQRLLKALQTKGFKISDWAFLDEYIQLHKKREKGSIDSSPTYIKDLVAGRPVFGHPSASGGFRFRYGRSRTAGFSATSIHPATMGISNGFLSTGTQLKIEKPTKGCIVTSCDSIDGPIVKLKDESVIKINSLEKAREIYPSVSEIIYFGDILFPFGDVLNRNYELIKAGYVEEWWELELKKALNYEINEKEIVDKYHISLEDAVKLSENLKIPLHPHFIFFWTQIKKEFFIELLKFLCSGVVFEENLILDYRALEREKLGVAKRALELLGVEHEITLENLVIAKVSAQSLLLNLGFNLSSLVSGYSLKEDMEKILKELESEAFKEKTVLEIVNVLSKYKIKDKAGSFIGSRMGRPEKAKLRKLIGSPSVLFPVGAEGGRFRSVNTANETGSVKSDFPIFFCSSCNKETIYRLCEDCGEQAKVMYYCKECHQRFENKVCPEHKIGQRFYSRKIDMKHYFEKAREFINMERSEVPILVKGVKGTSNAFHTSENLAKGFLRAKQGLCVNKDGTIRYDGTEAPITHFKPKEIHVSHEQLILLGYRTDIYGKPLENEEQILELKPHDILIPACPDTLDERGDFVFIKIAKFIDELLVKFYKMKPFYNVKKREDLVGHLVALISPHNCACVVGRIIGFSNAQAIFASPYVHAACRRDCVYPSTDFIYLEKETIKKEAIGDYVERLLEEGAKTKEIDNFGTLSIENNKEVYALGINPQTKELTKKRIKYFIKAKKPERWIKIRTSTGREQIMTPRHKFVYLDENNNFKVKLASEVKIGDKIALVKNLKTFNRAEEIFLPDVLSKCLPKERQKEIRITEIGNFLRKLVKSYGTDHIKQILVSSFNSLNDWYDLVPLEDVNALIMNDLFNWEDISDFAKIKTINNSKVWDLNLKITKELMSVFGYYVSEGYCRQTKTVSQVCFRIMERSQIENLYKNIKASFGLKASFGENKTKITICDKLVYYLFKYYFKTGSNAYEKRVPEIVFNSSKEKVLSFISSYFDGDGTIVYQSEKEKHKRVITFYSVNRKLLDDLAFLTCRFGLLGRYSKTGLRLPGKKILERYKELNKQPKKHILFHLTYSGKDFYELSKLINSSSDRKNKILNGINYSLFSKEKQRKAKIRNCTLDLKEEKDIFIDFVKEVNTFKDEKNPYCFEIDWKSEEDKNVLWGEQIINARCDGDELAIMMLLDTLINFSRQYLPSHRGGTQDAPLVLNARIRAGEVDDQILDFETVFSYPLELYELAEKGGHHSSEVKIENVKYRLAKDIDPFVNTGFTHDTNNFNYSVTNSSYKTIPDMQEKVRAQMDLVEKLRAVDTSDVARLIIDRHFMRDLRGNLRKFSQQQFRCVACNSKYRRPPLIGKCEKCGGKIIFTISYGSIVKYLKPALELAEKYNVPAYIKQNLELTKKYIESIFGKDTEKQEALGKWF